MLSDIFSCFSSKNRVLNKLKNNLEDYAREAMKMPDSPFWSRERGAVLSNKSWQIRATIAVYVPYF
jgi:hypothetical protein